jgi:hypothetical protein
MSWIMRDRTRVGALLWSIEYPLSPAPPSVGSGRFGSEYDGPPREFIAEKPPLKLRFPEAAIRR